MQIDVASQRILSFELIARPHDAYRADDIWTWIGRSYRDIGLPRSGERMERGIWEAKAIHGIPIATGAFPHEVRMGGLGSLGVRRITSYSPHTKSIESLFNRLQKVLGCTGVQVGRRRGEFEKATKGWLACRAGKRHPADVGFLHGDELVKRIANACAFLNLDPIEGEVYRGIPDELWKERVNDKNPLRTLDPAQSWIFAPVKRRVAIRQGTVKVRFAENNCSYYFTNPEVFADLGSGCRVIVCFDPAAPEYAVIFCDDSRASYKPAERICVAELVEREPQYSALDGFDDRAAFQRRRRYTAQCRKGYCAIIGSSNDRGVSATVARDPRGNEVRVEFGNAQPFASIAGSRSQDSEKADELIRKAPSEEDNEQAALARQACDERRLIEQHCERGELWAFEARERSKLFDE
jgi:hypothetical protein